MDATRVIVTGAREHFFVKGSLDEVGRKLSEAARAHEQFAWFVEESTDTRVGINPVQVAAISAAGD
jgi:hypothetical protein